MEITEGFDNLLPDNTPGRTGPRSYDATVDAHDKSFTVDEALSRYGLGWFQYKVYFKTGPLWIADAMEIMLLGFLYTTLDEEWDLTSAEQGMIGAVVFIGMFVGAFSWGYVSDKYGRRQAYVGAASFAALFGLFSAWSGDITVFLILRFLVGFGVAGGHAGFTIMSEYLPSVYRGKGLLLSQLWFSIGCFLEVLLAWATLPTIGWRWLLALTAGPAFIAVGMYFVLPESPHWYQVSGNTLKAKQALMRVAEQNEQVLIEGELLYLPRDRGSIFALFNSRFIRITIPVMLLWMCNCFVYYGIAIVTPILFGLSDDGYWDITLTTLSEIPGVCFTYIIIDKLGRIKTLTLLTGITGSMMVLARFMDIGSTGQVICIFLARMAQVGSFATIWIYTNEVFPTYVRGVAMGSCSSASRLAGIAVSFLAISMQPDRVCQLLGIVSCVACATTLFLKIETANRHLQQFAVEDSRAKEDDELEADLLENEEGEAMKKIKSEPEMLDEAPIEFDSD